MMSEMGINVVETEEAEAEDEEETREEPEEEETESGGEVVEAAPKTPAKSEAREPAERTDDPVRMYLREMGSVELLSREGEIAIAKRIEAGREAMIAGLCESPLSFQAVIIWRDELNEGKVFLRDIIDLEATYAGPDAKTMPAPAPAADPPPAASALGPWRLRRPCPVAPAGAVPFMPAPAPPQAVAPPSAPPAATPFKPQAGNGEADGEETLEEGAIGESDIDEDDLENSMSLAAIEAELKPKVLETFDNIADAFKRLRRLQDQDIQNKLHSSEPLTPASGAQIQEAQGRDHPRGQVAAAQSGAHRRAGRAALRHQQAAGQPRGPPDAARREPRRHPRGLFAQLPGLRARSALAQPRLQTRRQGLEGFRRQRQGPHQGAARPHPRARHRDRAGDRRVPQDRAHGAEGRARGAPGEEGDGGGEPAPGHLDRQKIHQPRPAVPRPHPGRQHRPDEGGRQVRVPPRLQILDLRHLVDPPGDHPLRSPIRRAPSASPCT